MNIVFCIDKNYEELAKISIASYRKHNPKAKITLISEYPVPQDVGYDQNVILKLTRKFRNRGAGDRITNAAYFKIFLTELPFKKILYVDADTLCQKPLDTLYDMPCSYINLCESYTRSQARGIGAKRYGLTGMMVMNLDNLRRIGFTEKCLNVEQNFPTPITGWQHDETCINVAMRDKLNFIDKKYNYCHNRKYENPIKESEAYILHYVGVDKLDMIHKEKYFEIQEIGDDIKGKRVAIVGNAKSLFSKMQGQVIDDHDFIIRFNKGFLYEPDRQGHKTSLLMMACNIAPEEVEGYHAKYVCNRSRFYNNIGYTLRDNCRMRLAEELGAQPSTGFIAIDICLTFKAKSIDLYGFDFEATPTFYNPINYKTQHKYVKEKEIVLKYAKEKKLTIN